MSVHLAPHTQALVGEHSARGQSLVEFALVLPMLLVLLLGVADFGRVFTAGIALEAAARDGAEAAAQEYVQLARNAPGSVLTSADYARLHTVAISTVCGDAETLTDYAATSPTNCSMPYTAVCVHDGKSIDPCGTEASAAPTECHRIRDPWTDAIQNANGPDPLPYIEVRVCYRFRTLFNLADLRLPLGSGISIGELWLERDRAFTVGDY